MHWVYLLIQIDSVRICYQLAPIVFWRFELYFQSKDNLRLGKICCCFCYVVCIKWLHSVLVHMWSVVLLLGNSRFPGSTLHFGTMVSDITRMRSKYYSHNVFDIYCKFWINFSWSTFLAVDWYWPLLDYWLTYLFEFWLVGADYSFLKPDFWFIW